MELPAYVGGDVGTVDLGDYLGEHIVLLAFYPADFSPACTDAASDLREFELFTMQKDVTVFAVSPDSVYAHAAFAERYDLSMPLLADTRRRLADAYGLCFEDEHGQALVRRAVVLVDHHGEVQYTWTADDLTTVPDVDEVRDAIAAVGGDAAALGRYRVGHAHYVEGRRAFTSAMGQYEDGDWMLAQGDFETATGEFEAAVDHFDSAVRFAETDDFETVAQRGKEKSSALRRAAEWLADSASAHANGQGDRAEGYRSDAERPLSTVRDLTDPPEPDAVTIEDGTAVLDDDVVVDASDASGREFPSEDDGGSVDDDAQLEAAVAAMEDGRGDEKWAESSRRPDSESAVGNDRTDGATGSVTTPAGGEDGEAAAASDETADGCDGVDPKRVEQAIRRAELDVSDADDRAERDASEDERAADAGGFAFSSGSSTGDQTDPDDEPIDLELTDPTTDDE